MDQVLFVGDDDTDEIGVLGAPAPQTTVRIDPHGETAARFCLEEQASIEILLAHLLADHADDVTRAADGQMNDSAEPPCSVRWTPEVKSALQVVAVAPGTRLLP